METVKERCASIMEAHKALEKLAQRMEDWAKTDPEMHKTITPRFEWVLKRYQNAVDEEVALCLAESYREDGEGKSRVS